MRIKIGRLPGLLKYQGCWARPEYKHQRSTGKQEKTDDGTPIWSIRAELAQDGEEDDIVVVAVPMDRNPSEGLEKGEEIVFKDVEIVSGARYRGRWERLIASGIVRRKRGNGEKK